MKTNYINNVRLSLAVLAFFAVTASVHNSSSADNGSQVTICHCPPGSPQNNQTMTVGQTAAQAHLAHGDIIGPCPTVQPNGTFIKE
jgi:hypothetical protein